MRKAKVTNIVLTDNTLENIKTMAPHLDTESQCKVFGIMLGIIWEMPDKKITGGGNKVG